MDIRKLNKLLSEYRAGAISKRKLLNELKSLPFADLGHAAVDHHRHLRLGFPEVVFGEGKKLEHLISIVKELEGKYGNFIITRVTPKRAACILKEFPSLVYYPEARIISKSLKKAGNRNVRERVGVICAGTADFPVAEESAVTLEILGAHVERVYDVGVSGIHRILPKLGLLNRCRMLIVVAGMEGALPSVVAGITGKPVIGVPTSVGYGTNLKGLSALLAMLNSCTPNVVTVNIDNGFGAAFFAHMITGMRKK